MKYQKLLTKLLIFTGLILLFVQCHNVDNESISILKSADLGLTTITGFIHNRDVYPNTKEITINVSHISGKERTTQFKTLINDDGTFRFDIDLARPQDVTMSPYVDFLYLIPNDSLHIELNFRDLTDVQLSGGKSAEINDDFREYFEATNYRIQFPYSVGTDMERNASWAEIINKLNEQRNELHNRRQAFLQNNNVHEEVAFLTEAMIELDYYSSLGETVARREHRFQKGTTDKNLLMRELNDVAERFFHSGIYSNAHFKFILSAYTSIAYFAAETKRDSFNDFIDLANEVAESEIIRDFMLTVQAGIALQQKDLDSFEKIAAHISNDYLLDRVMQEYRTTRRNMLNPENISSYILTGNSRDLTPFFSIKNNPIGKSVALGGGSVQVINIGASWCAPCKPVISATKELMKEYADKDVSFTFISITDGEESRRVYTDRGIDLSLVYFTNEGEMNYLFQTFSPMGLPYGILINKKGIIVDYGSHVRPGTGFREKIDLLLRQDTLIK
jgi:thiol-disulfide isomerase/thioredoxin